MELAIEQPTWGGQVRVAKDLAERGLEISPSGFASYGSAMTSRKIMKLLRALEPKSAQEGSC